VTRKVVLPSEDQVRKAAAKVVEQARQDGRRPTVTALAAALGLHHTTFWRHFPDVARGLVDQTRRPGDDPTPEQPPGRYARLLDDYARLKRDNAQLKRDLELAKAVIQRLALENAQLSPPGSNVIPFPSRSSG
jgi:AcrR family transcriptional regulator